MNDNDVVKFMETLEKLDKLLSDKSKNYEVERLGNRCFLTQTWSVNGDMYRERLLEIPEQVSIEVDNRGL